MPKNKPTSLSEVVKLYSSEGANDAKWILCEHQLAQAKMSVQTAAWALLGISGKPENDTEANMALDCYKIVMGMYKDILEHYTAFLSYLAGTDVSAKMSRKEL